MPTALRSPRSLVRVGFPLAYYREAVGMLLSYYGHTAQEVYDMRIFLRALGLIRTGVGVAKSGTRAREAFDKPSVRRALVKIRTRAGAAKAALLDQEAQGVATPDITDTSGINAGDRVRVKEGVAPGLKRIEGKEGTAGTKVEAHPPLWGEAWWVVSLAGVERPQLLREDWLEPA